ncbi:MAG TPA: glycine cleavage T C-terminal barrel domain-containing protein [Gemmatimonadaceae bacterium]|nr:glycine cleavage T C-terminal barrel domain-containing protein [Gemmatimonadaceae bacterium]
MSVDPVPADVDAAAVGEISGRSVVLAYAGVATEYEALRRHAVVFDRTHRGRMRLSGANAGEMLAGLVTNDVVSLAPGQGQYAAALTPKGKIVADLRIFRDESSFLVDVPPRASEGWMSTVRKYVNPRLSPYKEESEALRDLGVFGVSARLVVGEMTGVSSSALGVLPPYSHVAVMIEGARVLVARVPDLELEGFELFGPAETHALLWERALAAKATPGGLQTWEIARVEAGRPEWGVDIDESTLPQEANLEELHAISYTKGCYTGQETVARVHFRGHVNKHLRGLRSASQQPPSSGAALFDAEGKEVGDVRSTASSPRLGGIAIGMVRREVELGASLTARWEEGEAHVDVAHLPFPA